MKTLKELILFCLQEYNDNDDLLVEQLSKLIKHEGNQACALILKILTHIDFAGEKARYYWEMILKHHQELKEALDRDVSIRTAICDYFCSIDVSLRNPKFIEIPVYEENAKYSQYDFLTGLHSRSYFEKALEKELGRASRHKMDLSIIFFDLDNFKRVNDVYGHQAGDYVLEKVSEVIMKAQRKEDVSARYGGEELVMILPHTEKIKAYIFAERIREAVEHAHLEYKGKKIEITISGGIGSFPEDGKSIKPILKAADDALYLAKNSGRNEVIAFSSEKRIYMRVDYVEEVSIVGINGNYLSELKANSKNLSKSGILFENTEPIELGTKLKINLNINDAQQPVELTGVVVRTEAHEKDKYDIGVLFFNVESNIKNEISRYIVRQLNNKG